MTYTPKFKKGMTVQRTIRVNPHHPNPYYNGKPFTLTEDSHFDDYVADFEYATDPLGVNHYIQNLVIVSSPTNKLNVEDFEGTKVETVLAETPSKSFGVTTSLNSTVPFVEYWVTLRRDSAPFTTRYETVEAAIYIYNIAE